MLSGGRGQTQRGQELGGRGRWQLGADQRSGPCGSQGSWRRRGEGAVPGSRAPGSGGSVGQGLRGAWAERRGAWGEEEGTCRLTLLAWPGFGLYFREPGEAIGGPVGQGRI